MSRFFTPALEFDDIVRIYFNDGDVAHIRPSGNAGQQSIYANSDLQARADEIVELALREPDGIVRRRNARSRKVRSRPLDSGSGTAP